MGNQINNKNCNYFYGTTNIMILIFIVADVKDGVYNISYKDLHGF